MELGIQGFRVKEGISCVFFRATTARKSTQLSPSLTRKPGIWPIFGWSQFSNTIFFSEKVQRRDKSYLVLVHQMSLRGELPCASLRWRHSLMYPASLSNFGRLHAIYWICVWPFFLAPSLMPLTVVDQSSVTYAREYQTSLGRNDK